jgi:hypothetical protein
LIPQLVGSASFDHYLGNQVARPLNGLPHSASRSFLPLIRQRVPIDPEISVIVSTLTLASTMSGFGRPMCPLDVLRPSVRTTSRSQCVTVYRMHPVTCHLFSIKFSHEKGHPPSIHQPPITFSLFFLFFSNSSHPPW